MKNLLKLSLLFFCLFCCNSCCDDNNNDDGILVIKNYSETNCYPIDFYVDGELVISFSENGKSYHEKSMSKGRYILSVNTNCYWICDSKDFWISPNEKTVIEIYGEPGQFKDTLYISVPPPIQ